MKSKMYVKADEIAADLDVSVAYAYKVIQKLNRELKSQGYMVISGRVSRQFYEEKFYGLSAISKGD
jgi:hypothetical protein